MNVVGIRKDNQKVFESQVYNTEEEKQTMTQFIQNDALSAGIQIEIAYMSFEELLNYIDSH